MPQPIWAFSSPPTAVWNGREYNDGMPVTFAMDIHYHALDSTLRIGTLGRGAWRTKSLPNNDMTNIENLGNIQFSVGQPFPNPAENAVFLNYELTEKSNVEIEVFNYSGQYLNTLFNGVQNIGNQQIKWDLKNKNGLSVSSGIYFISVKAEGYRITRKVVIE